MKDKGDGFVLKNITVQNFKENGVLLAHADNFLLSHVATINVGAYGLFPVFCKTGLWNIVLLKGMMIRVFMLANLIVLQCNTMQFMET